MVEAMVEESNTINEDAFEHDDTVEDHIAQEEPLKIDRPDLVEIGDAFDSLVIDPVLSDVAKTNELQIAWKDLQKILSCIIKKQTEIMVEKIQDETAKKNAESLSTKIIQSINEHVNCPFTIQRLSELVIEPKKYYKMYIKYLRAVEKVLTVTSYWEDFSHKNDATQSTDDPTAASGEGLLLPASFTSSIELEPHNFEMPVATDMENVVEAESLETKEDIVEEDIVEDTVIENGKEEDIDTPEDEQMETKEKEQDEMAEDDIVKEAIPEELLEVEIERVDVPEESKMELD